MKLLKRIIEAAFLMASIMLLASDNVWCWIAAIVPFVDGIQIKEDTFYWLKDGEFIGC